MHFKSNIFYTYLSYGEINDNKNRSSGGVLYCFRNSEFVNIKSCFPILLSGCVDEGYVR